uniref:AB hydrolase-1 domain-containing protein n=2 Tax=Globisporangium ultimum (strain ATCC 200006 / CBS 805.95 / DAOM BR144) TaxID=431595 RepID=K3XD59_GLOUD
MCLYHPDRVLAVCSICTPYLPPTPQLVDIDAFVAAAPQFAYMKLLSQTETTAPLFDQAPRRLFTVMFKHHYELENMFVVDVFKNVVNSDSPLYTVRSDLLTEEELDYYEDEYRRSGFQASLNWYATIPIDFETERGLPTSIKHNALYIGARDDAVLKPEMAAHMPQFISSLEMAIINDSGHWVLWEQRDQVTEKLVEWLGKLENAVYLSSSEL